MNDRLRIALYQPDIAGNTGTILRFAACLDLGVEIIEPAGFPLSDRALKRAGMDYLEMAALARHADWHAFEEWRKAHARRLVLLTTKASESAYATRFEDADILMVGRESAGVPDAVAADADLRIRIPMRPNLRSLNVAVAATLIVGEAKRQTDQFAGLS